MTTRTYKSSMVWDFIWFSILLILYSFFNVLCLIFIHVSYYCRWYEFFNFNYTSYIIVNCLMMYIECDIFHFHDMYPNGIYGKIFWPIDRSIVTVCDLYLYIVIFFSVWLDRSNVAYVTIRMNNKLQLQLQYQYHVYKRPQTHKCILYIRTAKLQTHFHFNSTVPPPHTTWPKIGLVEVHTAALIQIQIWTAARPCRLLANNVSESIMSGHARLPAPPKPNYSPLHTSHHTRLESWPQDLTLDNRAYFRAALVV